WRPLLDDGAGAGRCGAGHRGVACRRDRRRSVAGAPPRHPRCARRRPGTGDAAMTPVQVKGEVLSVKQVGAYLSMTVVASGIAETAKPGQFVAVAIGGDDGSLLLRRAFSIHRVTARGVFGGTVEFV